MALATGWRSMNAGRTPSDYEEEFSDAPLLPDENRRMRRLLRDEERARWFWRTLRIWSGYITAAIIGIGGAAAILKEFLKGLPR